MMNADRDVKVYMASTECLENPQLFDTWLGKVPDARRKKVAELRNHAVRRHSLGAAALLMSAVSDYTDCASPDQEGSEGTALRQMEALRDLCLRDPQRIRMEEGLNGRPYFADFPDVHFSLSHSGDRVMCAVSGGAVGCDVEEIRSGEAGARRIRQASRCFAPGEQKLVREEPENFYRIWTLKESFLKLTGEGFRIPFQSFEISLHPCKIRQDIISTAINLKEYDRRDGYRYACMSLAGSIAENMIRVDLEKPAGRPVALYP